MNFKFDWQLQENVDLYKFGESTTGDLLLKVNEMPIFYFSFTVNCSLKVYHCSSSFNLLHTYLLLPACFLCLKHFTRMISELETLKLGVISKMLYNVIFIEHGGQITHDFLRKYVFSLTFCYVCFAFILPEFFAFSY